MRNKTGFVIDSLLARKGVWFGNLVSAGIELTFPSTWYSVLACMRIMLITLQCFLLKADLFYFLYLLNVLQWMFFACSEILTSPFSFFQSESEWHSFHFHHAQVFF